LTALSVLADAKTLEQASLIVDSCHILQPKLKDGRRRYVTAAAPLSGLSDSA